MSNELLLTGVFAAIALLLILLGAFFLVARNYRRVDSGTALVVRRAGGPLVRFESTVVLPIFHTAEVIDLSVHSFEVDCRGKHGVPCRDNIRADITATFSVKINRTAEDVLKVAESIGCARATDPQVLRELFGARFAEALRSCARELDFEALLGDLERFKDRLAQALGHDHNGYILHDIGISYVGQTPLDQLDPSNILDAEGIRKITERTTEQNIRTNELQRRERLEIARQNLIADEEHLRLEQQHAELKLQR